LTTVLIVPAVEVFTTQAYFASGPVHVTQISALAAALAESNVTTPAQSADFRRTAKAVPRSREE